MVDIKLRPGIDLVKSLSRLTGMPYEACCIEVFRADRPPLVDSLGNFNVKAYRNFARRHMVPDSAIIEEICSITDCSYEEIHLKLNFPDLA